MKKVGSMLCWLTGLGILLLLGACGSDDGSVETGTLQVALTDAIDHNFSEVVITIKEVRAVPVGDESKTEGGLPLVVSFDPPKQVQVLDLAYVQELLGEAELPAGDYSQLRLVLAENEDPLQPVNYVVMADDPDQLPIPVDTPSAHKSGLKVVGQIELAAGQTASVSLDFDPARAIVESGGSGGWQFKPTGIRMVQTEEFIPVYGALAGRLAFGDSIVQIPVSGAMVYAVPENGTADAAMSMASEEDGSFRLILPTGAYEIRVIANGFPDYSSLPYVYEVLEGEETNVGTLLVQTF